MRNRLLFLLISLSLLFVCTVSLAAQEEVPPVEPAPVEEPAPDDQDRVPLPDAPLLDEPEEEPAVEEPPAEEKPAEMEAEEPRMQVFLKSGSFFFGFGVGGILPLANFENSMTFGYELFLNAYYRFTDTLAVAALAGMTGISRADGGTGLSFYNLGAGLRGYLPLNGTFYGWAELGLNGHTANFNNFTFGYHVTVCAGWLWAADSALELGVEYDSTYTQTELYLKIFLAAQFKM